MQLHTSSHPSASAQGEQLSGPLSLTTVLSHLNDTGLPEFVGAWLAVAGGFCVTRSANHSLSDHHHIRRSSMNTLFIEFPWYLGYPDA